MIKLGVYSVTWLLAAIALFYLASFVARWSHRRFAGKARGKASHTIPRSGPPTELDELFAPLIGVSAS
ncbi:hypothetical protein [Pseudohalocynthiibacter sp. F2068]|uniref:hypothetical protein n=1 Tax=Pseudohalocynthiibacter sp. F2068 TaxID=2926418 RepID=UPI001FF4E33E|nr:hypothetical protein [Pseudohalocynthiibacter sp. F2068]MCK0103316.1 hypothetical protein [Pseudohalocynthiibacter sp. F2068]